MRLHRVVILGRGFVLGVDALHGGGMTGGEIALLEIGRRAERDRSRIVALSTVESDPRGLGLIGRGEKARALGRGLQRLGDDEGDGLLGIAHAVVLQRLEAEAEKAVLDVRVHRQRRPVGGRDHLDDARMCLGRLDIERGDPAARDGADRHDGMQHAGGMVVCRIGRGTRDLEVAVPPRQGLAARGAETDTSSGKLRRVKHGRELRYQS